MIRGTFPALPGNAPLLSLRTFSHSHSLSGFPTRGVASRVCKGYHFVHLGTASLPCPSRVARSRQQIRGHILSPPRFGSLVYSRRLALHEQCMRPCQAMLRACASIIMLPCCVSLFVLIAILAFNRAKILKLHLNEARAVQLCASRSQLYQARSTLSVMAPPGTSLRRCRLIPNRSEPH